MGEDDFGQRDRVNAAKRKALEVCRLCERWCVCVRAPRWWTGAWMRYGKVIV